MEWISTKHMLPEESQRCIICDIEENEIYIGTFNNSPPCFCSYHQKEGECHYEIYNWCFSRDSGESEWCPEQVTHWMPLPNNPEC